MDQIFKLFGGSEQLWQYIQKYATKAGIEGTRTVLEMYYVLKSPNTPMLDKTIIVAALAYQLLPEDLVSTESFGILGILDNGAALALAYNRVKTRVTPQIESQVNAILGQWFGGVQQPAFAGNNNRNSENKPYQDNCQSQTIQVPTSYETNQQQPSTKSKPSPMWSDDDVVID